MNITAVCESLGLDPIQGPAYILSFLGASSGALVLGVTLRLLGWDCCSCNHTKTIKSLEVTAEEMKLANEMQCWIHSAIFTRLEAQDRNEKRRMESERRSSDTATTTAATAATATAIEDQKEVPAARRVSLAALPDRMTVEQILKQTEYLSLRSDALLRTAENLAGLKVMQNETKGKASTDIEKGKASTDIEKSEASSSVKRLLITEVRDGYEKIPEELKLLRKEVAKLQMA